MIQRFVGIMTGIAMFAICIIIAITIALARNKLANIGLTLLAPSRLSQRCRLCAGYGSADWQDSNHANVARSLWKSDRP